MNLRSRFLKDPVKFARKHAIAPVGNPLAQITDLKYKWQYDPLTSAYQVQGSHRILHGVLTETGPRKGEEAVNMSADENLFGLRFHEQPVPDSFPVYWLPWRKDQILRTTLTPSKKFHVPLLENAALQEPHIFFTATLTGCSIFIEGSETEPTVYHANAGSTGGSIETPRGLIDKVFRMEDVYRSFSLNEVKKTPGPSGRALSAGRYMAEQVGGVDRSEDNQRVAKALGVDIHHPSIQVIGDNGRPRVRDVGQISASTYGTVFGVRHPKTGRWTFYAQHRVRANHWRKMDPSGPDHDPSTWKRFDTWTDLTVTQIWPKGSATVIPL